MFTFLHGFLFADIFSAYFSIEILKHYHAAYTVGTETYTRCSYSFRTIILACVRHPITNKLFPVPLGTICHCEPIQRMYVRDVDLQDLQDWIIENCTFFRTDS
jgi:hypothetical protein